MKPRQGHDSDKIVPFSCPRPRCDRNAPKLIRQKRTRGTQVARKINTHIARVRMHVYVCKFDRELNWRLCNRWLNESSPFDLNLLLAVSRELTLLRKKKTYGNCRFSVNYVCKMTVHWSMLPGGIRVTGSPWPRITSMELAAAFVT